MVLILPMLQPAFLSSQNEPGSVTLSVYAGVWYHLMDLVTLIVGRECVVSSTLWIQLGLWFLGLVSLFV